MRIYYGTSDRSALQAGTTLLMALPLGAGLCFLDLLGARVFARGEVSLLCFIFAIVVKAYLSVGPTISFSLSISISTAIPAATYLYS